jgi:hypothetical protein
MTARRHSLRPTFTARSVPLRRHSDIAETSNLVSWAAIAALTSLVAVSLLLKQGGILNVFFPALALAVGAYLFVVDPPLHLGFTWWLFFLTPEVRRLIDQQSQWTPTSPVMLAPYLVAGLTCFTTIRHFPVLRFKIYFGFVPILLALVYAALVGAANTSPAAASFALLNWAVPVFVASHIAINWHDYEQYRHTVLKAFCWGTLVMGAYGLVQYFVMPDWDAFWLIHVEMVSQGSPYPTEVRVFSTMNSSGPFATVIGVGLIAFMAGGGLTRFLAVPLGFSSFFLSLVRSAWIGWALGLCVVLSNLRGKSRIRSLLSAVVASALVVPIVLWGPFAETVNKRFETLYQIEEDASYQDRMSFYEGFLSHAVTNVVGEGLGSTGVATKLDNNGQLGRYGNFDSGVMQLPFVLGWFGVFAYLSGLSMLLVQAFRIGGPRNTFAAVVKGVVVMVGSGLIFVNTLIGPEGMAFWTFLGLALASRPAQFWRAT